MLNQELKQQLSQLLDLMEGDVVLKASTGSDENSQKVDNLVNEVAEMSSRITVEKADLKRTPSFSINRPGEDTGITFAGVPLGHEFNSFVLALLQVSGRAPKEEQSVIDQIKSIEQPLHFETYISLTCHKCPDVVQALNLMSVLNPNITHTMIDGAVFKEEAEDIMAVPAIFLNGEQFGNGRMTVTDILSTLGQGPDASAFENKEVFDVLVIGGGPASASSAIYAARKGLTTGIVADRIGGQVNDTADIENLIGVKKTTGPSLSTNLEEHIKDYNIDVMKGVRAEQLEKTDKTVSVTLDNGAVLETRSLIIGTGARWRKIGVPGEEKYTNKGVAYCPHCDGPLFEGKDVAVIGGGNSGIEAAIDLAGICKNVTVLEFSDTLKADSVLQERLKSLPNTQVITNAATKEITGDDRVNGLTYTDMQSKEDKHIDLDGVFVQIGLSPNTEWLGDSVQRNRMGEIEVDRLGNTNVPGVFAAGDCTDQRYKQIIISMGSGATAALSAFDYLIRN
ncbi:alkyl hydroperoxide reductase subunit F [Staphylococcus schleiferi]|uniref:Alkyl hydroperoxide reductase subunit F n=1 Tax=Staphylococcus coagulans TaxID=74706 RepID=A0ABU1EYW5_9STAP|nr:MULTISPECIES: alkyl hydroperoxide reductase subunit F [Staphylococcus]AKS68010.1 NADH dehydrogenase [Staphylococcus schleiferi]EGQ3938288.1 alkyl hydroperoxide reductase subunit F [Staphylococcus pseudintermedius]MBA8774690.1 alkyl hydroperoxide reductase subunit F [Staphylococcus coagulans]MBT2831440.1 alkyl hydroperoxide reductase subunit F [Staphylococcus coagulans]MBT2860525.1 alkyl hydroperoxide reductase subunit F [Staphylococcus coagulans]